MWLLLNHYWRTKKRSSLVVVTLLAVGLVLFKVYWWLLVVSGWAVVLAWRWGRAWWRRRHGERGHELVTKQEWLALVAAVVGGGALLASVT